MAVERASALEQQKPNRGASAHSCAERARALKRVDYMLQRVPTGRRQPPHGFVETLGNGRA